MVKRDIILVIGCGVAALAEYGRRRRARQRLRSDARQLHRWEDEAVSWRSRLPARRQCRAAECNSKEDQASRAGRRSRPWAKHGVRSSCAPREPGRDASQARRTEPEDSMIRNLSPGLHTPHVKAETKAAARTLTSSSGMSGA